MLGILLKCPAIADETTRAKAAEAALGQGVNDNKAAIQANGQSINKNAQNIAAVGQQANTNTQDIATLGQQANSNGEAITQNRNDIASLNNRVDGIDDRVTTNKEGIAISLALAGTPALLASETFAFSANWGGFEGANAFAAAGAMRLGDNVQLNGGVGFTNNTVGGRAGVRFGF